MLFIFTLLKLNETLSTTLSSMNVSFGWHLQKVTSALARDLAKATPIVTSEQVVQLDLKSQAGLRISSYLHFTHCRHGQMLHCSVQSKRRRAKIGGGPHFEHWPVKFTATDLTKLEQSEKNFISIYLAQQYFSFVIDYLFIIQAWSESMDLLTLKERSRYCLCVLLVYYHDQSSHFKRSNTWYMWEGLLTSTHRNIIDWKLFNCYIKT